MKKYFKMIMMATCFLGLCACNGGNSSFTMSSKSTSPRPYVPHDFDDDNITFKLGVVSDIHNSKNIPNAMKILSSYEGGMDALAIAGDITDGVMYYKTTHEYAQVKEKILNNVKSDLPIVMCTGNHDSSHGDHAEEFYNNLGPRFYSNVLDLDTVKTTGCSHSKIGKYHFLALENDYGDYKYKQNPDGSWTTDGRSRVAEELSPFAIEYAKSELEKIVNDPDYHGEYFFILSHLIPENTLCHSSSAKELNTILKKYPQAIVLSGHNHQTVYDERNIMQVDFTSINPGSLHYSDFDRVSGYIENTKGNEIIYKDGYNAYDLPTGMMLMIDNRGNVRIDRLDFAHANYLINDPWYLPSPQLDKSHLNYYGKDRINASEAPKWGDNPNIVATYNSSDKNLTINFNTPTDKLFVYEYSIQLLDNGGNVNKTLYTLSDFFIYPNSLDMPSTFKIVVPNVTSKPASIKLAATNTFRKTSEFRSASVN